MMPGLLQGSGTQPEEGAGPQPGYPPTPLHSGSRFTGFQQSKGNRYQVEVIFKHVDYENSTVCGYLKIQGLTEFILVRPLFEGSVYYFGRYKHYNLAPLNFLATKHSDINIMSFQSCGISVNIDGTHDREIHCLKEYPTLTTFFEGEIISRRYPFLTRKWDASEEVDKKHWGKFPPFAQFLKTFNSDDFSYEKLESSDSVFMRWKELFLVPDHKITDINGASFAGFYYICFQKSKGTIEGYYYHKLSEWYQSINLQHVPEETVSVFQFH